MYRPLPALFALPFALLACGEASSELPEQQVSFQAHRLACDVPNMEAWLKVTGVDGICPLEVQPDRTITGVCAGVPGKAQRVFRIEYTFLLRGERVQLASANLVVDLTDESSETVVIDFSNAELMTDLDDDGDGTSNIVEFCTGRDPRNRNG